MSIILAIESSCDEMSVAILKDKRELLCNVVASQIDVHRLYGGVVPEIASRMHVECVSTVLKTALNEAQVSLEDIDAVAVTKGPGLVGSLHVGMQAAKTIALAYHKPLIGVHHIVGYVGLWAMYEQSQITTIGIDPRFQKQGLGTLLLAQMIEEAKRLKAVQMSLEVRVSNDKAIGLYKKCGFEKVAIRKGYYQDNHEDAYLMVKQWEAEA